MVKQRLLGERAVLIAAMCTLLVGGFLQIAAATDSQWAWMKGFTANNTAGTYGTRGVADPANTPGARGSAVSWTDPGGILWLFGGYGVDIERTLGMLNDLWKYDRTAGNWTWMSGSNVKDRPGEYGEMGAPHGKNTPGGRSEAVSWTDQSGRLWLFGGQGYDESGTFGFLNDLWMYDTGAMMWTWMKGASAVNQQGAYGERGIPDLRNTPGARWGAVSWVDVLGRLWLFGGYGYDAKANTGYLNDLWFYDIDSDEWTWVKGAATVNEAGVYGEMGVSAEANTPGARQGAVAWKDSHGRMWLFGGSGYDTGGYLDLLNDLWLYDLKGNEWTWMNGSPKINQSGIYGEPEVPERDNVPGARQGATGWADANGRLWLLGGYGLDSVETEDLLNDLWRYDTDRGDWTWMKGSEKAGEPGRYGAFRMPDPDNTPGARYNAVSWADSLGAFWLFGGWGLPAEDKAVLLLNDLWRWHDAVKPTGTVLVNNNRSVTNNVNVTLSLTWSDGVGDGSGVVRMKFSNDAVTWTAWEPLAATKAWTMLPGDGYKTVRVMYRDRAGNNSLVYHDYIRLDTAPPTGSIIINGGASSTADPVVSLGLAWDDGTGAGVTRMRFSIDGMHWSPWEPPVTPRPYTLPSTPQYYTVRVQYLDGGNNYSAVYNDYIKLVVP